mgnify:FL=1
MKVHYYSITDEIHGRPIAEVQSSSIDGLKSEFSPAKLAEQNAYTFIDILIEDETEDIEANLEALRLKEIIDISQDVMEEIITDQRPRADDYPNFFLILFKCFTLDPGNSKFQLKEHQIGILIRKNVIISIHRPIAAMPISMVFQRFNKYPLKMAKGGLTYLVTTYLDIMVDQVYDVLNNWSNLIAEYERELVQNPRKDLLFDILKIRHRLLDLVKILQADREIVNNMKLGVYDQIKADLVPPELDDHIKHMLDETDIVRNLLNELLNIYYSSESAHLNETMKRFTFITSLILVPSLIAGIFGMNFFTGDVWGMYIVIVIMLLIVTGLFFYFKRKKYI